MSARKPVREAAASAGSVREKIVLGARKHFLAHGFRGVTMDDVAEELGMSKKTLYAHFRSKVELVQAVLRDKADRAEADFARITADKSTGFLEMLHEMLACMKKHSEEIQPPFIRDLRRETPELFKIVETRRKGLIQKYFGSFFARGRKQGMIRKDVPTDVITEVLLVVTQAIVNPAKMEELKLSPKTAYTSVLSIVLEGVFTTKRRAS